METSEESDGGVGRERWRRRKKVMETSEESGGDVGRKWWRRRKKVVETLEGASVQVIDR